MFGKTVYGTTFKDVNFVPLQSATFCVQCELISTSNKPYCLACGSQAWSVFHVFLADPFATSKRRTSSPICELDSLVRDLLRTVPDPQSV